MNTARPPTAGRILLVGDDGEVSAALHLHLQRAGWAPSCLAAPELLDALLRPLAPHAIVLMLPAAPGASWGPALSTAASAARVGVRVVVVAPSREVVEPLAAVAGAERALARADVLRRPMAVLEASPASAPFAAPPAYGAPPPLPRPFSSPVPPRAFPVGAPPPPSLSPPPSIPSPLAPGREPPAPAPVDLGHPAPRPAARTGASDLLALIDEELVDEPEHRPRLTRIEVSVTLVSEHNFYVGPTRRIDSGGVFISTMLPPPVGTPLEVRLGLADGRKVEAHGAVVFVRERSAISGRQPAGCGVRLQGLPGWAVDAIDRFLLARPPIVYVAP